MSQTWANSRQNGAPFEVAQLRKAIRGWNFTWISDAVRKRIEDAHDSHPTSAGRRGMPVMRPASRSASGYRVLIFTQLFSRRHCSFGKRNCQTRRMMQRNFLNPRYDILERSSTCGAREA